MQTSVKNGAATAMLRTARRTSQHIRVVLLATPARTFAQAQGPPAHAPNVGGRWRASHHARVVLPATLALRLTSCAAHKSYREQPPSMGLSPHFSRFSDGRDPPPMPTMLPATPPLGSHAMPTQRTRQGIVCLSACMGEGGTGMAWP